MSEALFSAPSLRILYDPERVTAIAPEWLDPSFWRLRRDVVDELGGRGQALHLATPAGAAVLRRYLRGGQAARLSRDRFLFSGYERSRALREWRVLALLRARGLPVPAPLMASCERSGPTYRAGLLTELLPETVCLADVAGQLASDDWQRLSRVLREFFDAGLVHADLNARNILIDAAGRWYLIDFDRARLHDRPVRGDRMLARLHRSLVKLGLDEHLSGQL
ncbi:3-deoxy-D-manno-octulosonic acid kinase [Wenzhouxiangella sp. AB-CW3]|uniref:3-deoxy-D-manno-octulosonic acid kinase n=1 Tax=Wenzhouxiangella sp. AB-CW3 TaxID=2771012 RepID=UPI00168B1CB7|nr:3-deoxy-D-manno-octulosonic acid kinase [Wenzhouxiangella sp. AB-CW3]QOC21729.1 3-deoxy-D-manno-octulosonic acid kinase [Wenzhouxiangella sp. AB-CW3]